VSDNTLRQQAEQLAAALPRMRRYLFGYDEEDLALGLTVAQLRMCILLADEPGPMSSLSRELGISLSAVTQIADRLERAGLAERTADEGDRRVRNLRLTARGVAMMRQRRERRVRRILQVLRSLSPEQRQKILDAVQLLAQAAQEHATDDSGEPPPAG
jgi:DNA-binding MarR family transcriptional regulator